jgi:hypothetical protein
LVTLPDSTQLNATQVFVGGILQTSDYTLINSLDKIGVEFDTAPPNGVEVTLQVRRGRSWYNPLTPALPLSETDTRCARFIRGEI